MSAVFCILIILPKSFNLVPNLFTLNELPPRLKNIAISRHEISTSTASPDSSPIMCLHLPVPYSVLPFLVYDCLLQPSKVSPSINSLHLCPHLTASSVSVFFLILSASLFSSFVSVLITDQLKMFYVMSI